MATTWAPWKSLFESHLQKLASAEFHLATVTDQGLPRVRTCIYRGFWTELPENSHNKLPKNPRVFASDCPTFSTDARMHKVFDIFATGKGKGTLEQSRAGTGGGGPVEAVYWVKDVMTQWRVKGQCWLIAADDVEHEGDGNMQNSGTVSMKAALQPYMHRTGEDGDWSWKREIENHFGNLSPWMRGTFKNPPPGQPMKDGAGPGERLGQKADDLGDEELARRNFRVAVIVPQEVERCDMSNPDSNQRWIWTLRDGPEAYEWDEVETWP